MNTIECKLIKTHMKNTRNQNLYSTIKYNKCIFFLQDRNSTLI